MSEEARRTVEAARALQEAINDLGAGKPPETRETPKPWPYGPDRRAVVRVESCACGGVIEARGKADNDIVEAMVLHQETGRHMAWRLRQLEDENGQLRRRLLREELS